MKDVFNNYDKYRIRGKKQMLVNRDSFTHDKMREKLIKLVDGALEGVAQEVELKLPKLVKKSDIKIPKLKKG